MRQPTWDEHIESIERMLEGIRLRRVSGLTVGELADSMRQEAELRDQLIRAKLDRERYRK